MLIGLSGKAAVGKNTVAMYLVRVCSFSRAAIEDPIYAAVGEAFGIDPDYMAVGENRSKPIEHLNQKCVFDLVKEMRTLGQTVVSEDHWLKHLEMRIVGHLQLAEKDGSDVPGIVVTDIRTEKDAAWLRELGGVVVHVLRHTGLAGSDDQSPILFQQHDKQIDNNGSLTDLGMKIDTLLRHMKRETPSGILLPAGARVH